MNGSAIPLAQFLSNTSARFFVPVYQRAYSWTERQCQQLFDDLEGVLRENRATHFFGSIVLQGETRGAYTDYQVIDGQQRITTLLLLLLALHDLLANDLSASAENRQLGKAIMGRYLIDLFAVHQEERLRLHLCGADAQTWKSLLGLDGTPVGDSPLKRNRLFFEECLRHASYPPERIYDAIQKLVVICITLGADDDPQLIFESLNATGLALTEGDKVRNFLLMSLPPAEQERLHARHWTAIERHTRGAVSELNRDFLSIKRQRTPRLDAVYATFKQFFAESGLGREAMLQELERYAKWFGQLRDCGARDWFPALRASLYRLNRLDVAVLRPFALEVLRRHEEGALTQEELLAIFTTVEAYLLRRAICEVPTNALNKIFLTLDGDIARLTHGGARYVDVFAYILLSKQGGGRFPDDKEFRAALAARQVYKMGRDYRHYLFERLENGGYKETKDVYAHLDRGEYPSSTSFPSTSPKPGATPSDPAARRSTPRGSTASPTSPSPATTRTSATLPSSRSATTPTAASATATSISTRPSVNSTAGTRRPSKPAKRNSAIAPSPSGRSPKPTSAPSNASVTPSRWPMRPPLSSTASPPAINSTATPSP